MPNTGLVGPWAEKAWRAFDARPAPRERIRFHQLLAARAIDAQRPICRSNQPPSIESGRQPIFLCAVMDDGVSPTTSPSAIGLFIGRREGCRPFQATMVGNCK